MRNDKGGSPILKSALEFLVEALTNLKAGKLSFAVLHSITSVELTLKERLWRLNPGLILHNVDASDVTSERTVSLAALPRRLDNLGIPLESNDRELIRETSQWRHEVVHHVGTFDAATANKQIGKVLDFLSRYLRKELATPLEDFLPSNLFADANKFIDDWHVAVSAAAERASKNGNVLAETCPRCGSEHVMTLRASNQVHCHLCAADLFRIERCEGCGKPTLTQQVSLFGDNYCDDCIEAAGDHYVDLYVQQQADLLRGK